MRAIYSVGFIVSGSAMFALIMILVFASREPLHAPLQEAHVPVEELKKDTDDLNKLIGLSIRPQIRGFLQSFAKKLDRQIQRQEELILEGDRLSSAALRHTKVGEFGRARLELSAARSAYQRAAASDKVERLSLMEGTLTQAEMLRTLSTGDPSLPAANNNITLSEVRAPTAAGNSSLVSNKQARQDDAQNVQPSDIAHQQQHPQC